MAQEVLDREFGHEQLTVFHDSASGVTGAIAIHSTVLGPAMGGLRLFRYRGLSEALIDVVRLARAMSFKNAAAGLPLGGGKAVLLDDGAWDGNREERMRAVGATIESLGGRYVTAEDVGTTPADMDSIAEVTDHVAGGTAAQGGSGDPSPFTARTVFASIEAAARIELGRDSVAGLRVGVQGVGNVGAALVGLLAAGGADVFVTDIDSRRGEEVASATAATFLPNDGFAFGDFDVFAPCALGGVIGFPEVELLRAPIIAGAANNPLAHRDVATALGTKGILYVPDFIANSGGIIHVGAEVLELSAGETSDLLEAACRRAEDVLTEARETGLLPLELAEMQAVARLSAQREPSP